MLFDENIMLYHLLMDQTLKICVKEMWQKASVLFILIAEKVINLHFWNSTPGFPWAIGIQPTEKSPPPPLLSLQMRLNFTLAQGLYVYGTNKPIYAFAASVLRWHIIGMGCRNIQVLVHDNCMPRIEKNVMNTPFMFCYSKYLIKYVIKLISWRLESLIS